MIKKSVVFILMLLPLVAHAFPLESLNLTNGIIDETLVKKQLPDPNVMVDEKTNLVYLTGTGHSTLNIYISKDDGLTFPEKINLNPSDNDKLYNYCSIWGPELNRNANGKIYLAFVSVRIPKNKKCDNINRDQITIFHMTADSVLGLKNAKISPVLFGKKGPQAKTTPGCYAGGTDGCEKTIRISPHLFVDPKDKKEHFFYVWFSKGNNISSFETSNPERITRRVSPTLVNEERIIENPDVFKRGEYYYFVMTRGHFLHNYKISYMYSKNLSDLKKGTAEIYDLTVPTYMSGNGKCSDPWNYNGRSIKENNGHTSTTKIKNNYYMYYHKNFYKYDSKGCHNLSHRDAYRKKLNFLADGKIAPFQLNYAKWNMMSENHVYSLDYKMKNGKTIGPCKHAGILGKQTTGLIDNICYDGNKAYKVNQKDVASVRICSSNNGWKNANCSPFNKLSSEQQKVKLILPTYNKTVQWQPLIGNYEYSVDITLNNGARIAPCIDARVVGNKNSQIIEGYCTNGIKFKLSDLKSVRVCASDDKWQSGRCSPYTTGSKYENNIDLNFD